tara:strand:- start:217 stop:636 length:420 start_codon:yes stop_codon:yes gene_type:complete
MDYKIIAKYIKEIDFKIPNPKIFFSLTGDIKNYKINIDIKSNQFKENIIEIETSLNLKPVKENIEKINTKIIYSTIIELQKKISDKKILENIILVKVPTQIYDDLRKSFVFLFETSGFKDIKIEKNVDFQKLYNFRKVQ